MTKDRGEDKVELRGQVRSQVQLGNEDGTAALAREARQRERQRGEGCDPRSDGCNQKLREQVFHFRALSHVGRLLEPRILAQSKAGSVPDAEDAGEDCRDVEKRRRLRQIDLVPFSDVEPVYAVQSLQQRQFGAPYLCKY